MSTPASLPARFGMSLDGLNRGVTWVVAAVVAAVAGAVGLSPACMVALPVLALVAAGLALAWALAPAAIEIDRGAVRICRRAWGPLEIPLPAIAAVEVAPKLGCGLRLFGVGGFFGSYGLFWTREIGRFRAYVTRRGAGVLVRRRDGLPVLVTPDDPEAFVRALEQARDWR